MRFVLIRLLFILIFFICAGMGFFSLIGTSERAIPRETPGYAQLNLPVPHRDAPIPLHVWYPAAAQTKPGLLAQNHLFYGHYVQQDAAPAPGPHPLILVSHGSGGNAPQLGWIIKGLVQAGFAVAAPNHPGTTSGDSDPFQTIEIWNRPLDLSAALDRMLEDAPQDLQIDPKRLGVMGFSLGGHSALSLSGLQVSKRKFIDYCTENVGKLDCGWMQRAGVDFTTIDAARYEASYKDPRITATVAIDPALPRAVAQESLTALAHPVQIINLGETLERVSVGLRADSIAQALPGGRFTMVNGSWHFDFLAECSFAGKLLMAVMASENICADPYRDRADIHADLRAVIVPFFTQVLKP